MEEAREGTEREFNAKCGRKASALAKIDPLPLGKTDPCSDRFHRRRIRFIQAADVVRMSADS